MWRVCNRVGDGMLDTVYIWVSLAFMFLLGSIWGEYDVKFGVFLVPLFSALFWLVGWLPDEYAQLALSFALTLGAITFLKDQYRAKFGNASLGGFSIWPIMAFIIFIQLAAIFVCGSAYIFGDVGTGVVQMTNTTVNNFNLVAAETVYGNVTQVNEITAITTGLQLGWMALSTLWAMLFGVIGMYGLLANTFGVPAPISFIITAGIYILLAIEVVVILMFKTRPPTV